MITLDPYAPEDIDNSPGLTVAYLVRYQGSRVAWIYCFGGRAIVWWFPEDAQPWDRPKGNSVGMLVGSPHPNAPYWHVSSRFEDALEYMHNGILLHTVDTLIEDLAVIGKLLP